MAVWKPCQLLVELKTVKWWVRITNRKKNISSSESDNKDYSYQHLWHHGGLMWLRRLLSDEWQQLQSGLTMDFLMCVSLLLALFSANSRLLMSFRRALYLPICSLMINSTHLQGKRIHLHKNRYSKGWLCCTKQASFGEPHSSFTIWLKTTDIRSGLADVFDALQWVNGVWAAKDAGSKDNGEGVGWHPVCLLLQGYPVTHQNIILSVLMWRVRECDTNSEELKPPLQRLKICDCVFF